MERTSDRVPRSRSQVGGDVAGTLFVSGDGPLLTLYHQRLQRWLTRMLWLIAAVLTLATLIALINSNLWFVRNVTFPQAQITACLVIVLVAAIVLLDRSRASGRTNSS